MHASLTETLPDAVAGFLSARNRRDYDTATAAFSPTAAVHDEGGLHTGRDAIRKWMEDTVRRYDDTAEIVEWSGDDGAIRVTARVSGDFPGSPALLRFAFFLDGDAIARLEIGA